MDTGSRGQCTRRDAMKAIMLAPLGWDGRGRHAAKPELAAWTRIEDGLPEGGGRVLVRCRVGGGRTLVMVASYHADGSSWSLPIRGWDGVITHWAPWRGVTP